MVSAAARLRVGSSNPFSNCARMKLSEMEISIVKKAKQGLTPCCGCYLSDEEVGSVLCHCCRHLLHRFPGSLRLLTVAACLTSQGQEGRQDGAKVRVNRRSCSVIVSVGPPPGAVKWS